MIAGTRQHVDHNIISLLITVLYSFKIHLNYMHIYNTFYFFLITYLGIHTKLYKYVYSSYIFKTQILLV